MLICLRPLLAAGAIVAVVFLARSCSGLLAKPAPASLAVAGLPLASAPLPIHSDSAAPEAPSDNDDACDALLRDGRFADLLQRAAEMSDETERARWLCACARLAPPRVLAEQALRLPPGAARDSLLETALERWVLDAPAELGEWASVRVENERTLDFALARIVEHTDSLHRSTATALAWTQLIRDPALRFRALQAVVREWAARDPDAALRFAETAPDLANDQRAALLALLATPASET